MSDIFELIKVNEFPEQDFVLEGGSWFVIAGENGLAHKISDLRLRQYLLDSGIGPRVIEPGTLVINSSTSSTLTGARWMHQGGVYEFTGDLPIPASPSEPNNRFDIVTFGDAPTPVVKAGDPLPEPNVPNPDTGFLLAHTIYRPYGGGGIVTPVNPRAYSTAVSAGGYGKYAPIWRQTLGVNAHYGFKISFVSWSSEYGANGQYPSNGFVMVNFDTGSNNTNIDPARVSVRCMDIGVDNGDFMLVQTGAAQATLYAKKKSYLGNMSFQWVQPYEDTVQANSLVNGGAYVDLPGGATYPSYNGRDYVSSTMPVRFDLPRQYGLETRVTGNITFPNNMGDPLTNPTRVDTNVVVKVFHNSATEPDVVPPLGVWVVCDGGEYAPGVDNVYYLIAHKNNTNEVVGISYTITQNTI